MASGRRGKSRIATLAASWLACCLVAVPLAAQEPIEATSATKATYSSAEADFDWSDEQDFANAERGLVARSAQPTITDAAGRLVWTFPDYDALRHAPAPPTVHPLLWRQQRLNSANGLFQVVDGVYQLRGFDLANMTVIEGETGIIVVDPLTSVESAKAALDLYYMHRPRRPVVAVIYTHTHVDHFGGAAGIVSRADVEAGKVPIYAPEGFLREAVSENLTAGNAMLRRTIYYSGVLLPRTPYGSVGAGLGPGVANGRQSFIAPTDEIAEPGGTRIIDGVEFQFMLANETEAPAEMVFYLPRQQVLDMAEVAVRTVHNVLTPRGAPVRSTAAWWKAIDKAQQTFGGKAQVLIGQHHWPTWGNAELNRYLELERDFYKLINDRSLNLINKGETRKEIGEQLTRTDEFARAWPLQDYYGTLGSGGEAVYHRYIGWYDGNPANLDALPDAESARRYVEYMGGAKAILSRARADYARGDYRWVAEVLNRLIFDEPDNRSARELQADTLTQLGYQQVSATWRNVYLMAAMELRNGPAAIPPSARVADYISQLPPDMLLDYAGIALSPTRSAGRTISLDLAFQPAGKTFRVEVANGLLNYREAGESKSATRVALGNEAFDAIVNGRTSFAEAMQAGSISVTGNAAKGAEFFSLFDSLQPSFNIVTP